MTITTTFTKTDQLDAEGKKIDDYFTIKEVETVEYEKVKTLSGTEVAAEIKEIENMFLLASKKVLELQEMLNFYKSLK
jgi:hypothetical protein